MKIEAIEDSLHDAELERLSIDYIKRKAEFDLIIWIEYIEGRRSIGRKGRLTFSGFVFCTVEPPRSRDIDEIMGGGYEEGPEITSSGPIEGIEPDLSDELLAILPDEAFTYFFYFSEWQACIYIAATDASFEWLEEQKRYDL